jgi:hypothetical protein
MVLAGAAWLLAIVSYQHAHRLNPAPAEVQTAGLAIMREALAVLKTSAFGSSNRGQIICAEIDKLLDEERVVFAAMHTTRGLTWDPILGRKTIYIKVLPMTNGRFLHQRPQGMIEALAHEAVHSIKNTRGRISIEEEYDCFTAGIEAGLYVAGRPVPIVLSLDGKTVAEFVLAAYPNNRHDPRYKPVGATFEWLLGRVRT